jgi:shikimate kinase
MAAVALGMSISISLIGLPGSGKSTVGRQLARHLQVPFADSDQVIEMRLGCSIRAYFEREGEARFRDIEADVIDELTQQPGGVLSTGGGVVLREANRLHLRQRTQVVYLNSAPEVLFRRLRHDKSRPLLQVADPLGRLRDLHAQRDPLYRDTARFNIDTGRPSVASLVNLIMCELEKAGAFADCQRQGLDDPQATINGTQSAARWTGIVDGAPDLSTNPAHMHGFGQ